MKKSLAHLPLNKKQELKRLKSIILAEEPKTEFIILFGSHARGDWVDDEYQENHITYRYQSDFDILVITEDKESAAREGTWMRIENKYYGICHDRTPIDIIRHHIREVNNKLKEGHYFFSDIKQEGVLLYDSGSCKLERRRRIDPARRLEIAVEDFELWFESANGFFRQYKHAVNDNELNIAAFELHQATERFYDAALLVCTGYCPKLHNIERLGRMISRVHPEFLKIFPQKTKREKDLFKQLKKAYVDARYKKDYRITQDELDYLVKRVEKLRDLVERTCRNKITELKQALRASS
ncbi:MAG: HEPN domain-containing protein [Victivallaceae bacterium]|nr:HEPN domain-containing protein [Victivallaceae bacterium]